MFVFSLTREHAMLQNKLTNLVFTSLGNSFLELFKELNWQTFPKKVTYQKAIVMYRIINNICPDYLKKTMSHILLT